MTVIVEPVPAVPENPVAPSGNGAALPASPPKIDPRLYGIFDDPPKVAPTPDPTREASLNLSIPSGTIRPDPYPDFRERGLHGNLTRAFTPSAKGVNLTIQAESPTGAWRAPTPAEIALPPEQRPNGTLDLTHPPTISSTNPSFAEQSEARITAATTERLPPRPQDGMPGPTRPQRASAGRVAFAELREQFNPAAARISFRPPNQPQGTTQGRTNLRFSVGSGGRVGGGIEMTF